MLTAVSLSIGKFAVRRETDCSTFLDEKGGGACKLKSREKDQWERRLIYRNLQPFTLVQMPEALEGKQSWNGLRRRTS